MRSAPAIGLALLAVACSAWSMDEGAELLPPAASADFRAVRTGRWSNPDVWDKGQAPWMDGGSLDVLIPSGITVTVNRQFDEPAQAVDTLRLEGTLAFDRDRDTRLWVDTLVSLDGGTLQIGSPEDGGIIQPGFTAELVIADGCAGGASCFSSRDPSRKGQGLLLNGPVRIAGAPKQPFAEVQGGSTAGSPELLLAAEPAGWSEDDEIVLAPTLFVAAATDAGLQQAERFRIRDIQPRDGGSYAVLLGTANDSAAPAVLQHDHLPYDAGAERMAVHVANLTRNVVIRSQRAEPTLDQRGHVLVHTPDARIQYVELRNLGRTDKKRFVDDPDVGGEPPEVENNKRGRYPLHFHRSEAPGIAIVTGAVVNTSPGWGFVNHASTVNFDDCVSFNVDGAGFVAETGGETGRFYRSIAIQGFGAPDGRYRPVRFEDEGYEDSGFQAGRNGNGDLAFTGDGFWVQSPAVRVLDNVAAGFQGNAFALWNMGLFEPDLGAQAGLSQLTVDAVWGEGVKPEGSYRRYTTGDPDNDGKALPNDFPARDFKRNVAYASFIGFRVRFHNHSNTKLLIDSQSYAPNFGVYTPTTLSNLTAWNNQIGLGLSYVLSLNLTNVKVLSNQPCSSGDDGGQPTCFAINANKSLNSATSTTRFDGLRIAGYRHAIDLWQGSPRCETPPAYCLSSPSIDISIPSEAIYWGIPDEARWYPAGAGCSPTPPPLPPECP